MKHLRFVYILLIPFFVSPNPVLAGFWDDAVKAIGDGVKEGMEKGLNNGRNNNKEIEARYMKAYRDNDDPNIINYGEKLLIIVKKKGDTKNETGLLHDLSEAYYRVGDVPKSINCSEEGLKIARRIDNKELILKHLNMLGQSSLFVDGSSKSFRYLEEAVSLAKILNDLNEEALSLANMARIYITLGDYSKTLRLLEQSATYRDKIQNSLENRDAQSNIYHYMGITYIYEDNYQKGVDYLLKTAQLKKENKFMDDMENNLGHASMAYLMMGDKQNANKLFKYIKPPILKAEYYLLNDEPEKTITILDGILKEKNKVVGAGVYPAIYTMLGISQEKKGNTKSALEYYKKAVVEIEKERELIVGEDRVNFLQGKDYPPFSRLTAYEGIIRNALPVEAFHYSEAVKSRILLEQMAGKHNTTNYNLPNNILVEENNINDTIALISKKMIFAWKKNDGNEINKLERDLAIQNNKKENFVNLLRKSYPEYATIRYPTPLKLSDIGLKPGEVLIEYAVTDSKTLGWLVKNGNIIKTMKIDISRIELNKLIDRYLEQINNPIALRKQYYDSDLGNKLYTLLLSDIITSVDPKDKIIIVPDKKLGLLPFETLITTVSPKRDMVQGKYGYYPIDIKYFGDEYDISYYQSASALNMMRTLKKFVGANKALFVLSDPIFDRADERLKYNSRISSSKVENNLMRAVEDGTGIKLSRLNETKIFSEKLLSMFKGQEVTHLTGLDASEAGLRKNDLSNFKYMVFATHGILDSKISGIMEPALVLTQIGNEKGDNGFLTMSKVMGLKLNCEIAALTACETGSGKLVNGEGVIGLGRAFQYAGAKSVLVSLWSVSEGSTVKLIEKYFYYLKIGKDRSSALRMARNDIRKDGYEHPFFWSPFILIGEEY